MQPAPQFNLIGKTAMQVAQGRRWPVVLVALLCGAIAALGQAPLGWWHISVLGFAGLMGLFQGTPTPRRAALIGWAGGTGYFLVALNWLVEPFMVDVARHGWMAPFALGLMSAGLALFWGASFALARRAGGSALGFISAITLAEALRGWLFTGFPWAQPGHIWIGTPVMPLAAYVGALGLIIVTFCVATLVWRALCGRYWYVGAVAGLFATLYIVAGLDTPAGPLAGDAPTVRLIQPNAAQHEKWDPEMIPVFFQRQVSYTQALPAPDLIVWPETAIPTLLNYAEDVMDVISSAAGDTPVVFGAQRWEGQRLHNSMAVLNGLGEVTHVYDKHHLVPFGEYLPFGNVLKRFGLRGLAAEDGNGYSSGPGPRLLDLGALGKALPLICYEGVFPRDVAGMPARADFILLITNDAWFGQYSGPYQHLAQARLRSVEQGLPTIRVANTGVSAMIDAHGHLTAALSLGTAGYLDARLPAALPATLYSKTGDLPLLILLFLVFGGVLVTSRRQVPLSD